MYAMQASELARNSATFRNAAASTGAFEVSQRRLNNVTDDYISKLKKQKVGLREFANSRKLANAAFKEQLALQQMAVRRVGTSRSGQGIYDVMVPNTVHKNLDSTGKRLAFLREELKSVAQQTVNWGKNMQWAGRQLMVGFTIPMIAFGAAAGVFAYQVDKQMTRIRKVYNTTADQNNQTQRGQMAVAQELARVTQESFEMAKQAAYDYGAAIEETLEVEADLAATGLKGAELRQSTTEVVKNATLGEIDYQTATNATIALQSTFRMDAKKTAEAWAYMNSVENATSLSMADFAKAIPIAAGPIRDMGGDIKLLGQYLVSMRERGIQANQGANAIKAMMNRLYRPSKQVREEFEKLTKVSLTGILDAHPKGDIKGIMEDIADAAENLTGTAEIKAFAGLFGTYQVGRMKAILEGVRDLRDGVGQTSVAYEIAQQGADKWFTTQEHELEQFRKSLSGKFKIAVQSFKAELAGIGTIFLEAGIKIINVAQGMLNAFNNLPEGTKHIIALTAMIVAIIGPIVMLVGLFGNLGGNIVKAMLTFAGLGSRMKLVTTEEKHMEIATEMANAQMIEQGNSAAHQAAMIDKLRMSMVAANAEMGIFARMRAPTGLGEISPIGTSTLTKVQDANGRWHDKATGGFVSAPVNRQVVTPTTPIIAPLPGVYPSSPISMKEEAAAALAKKTADEQKKNALATGRAAAGTAAMAASMGVMMFSTNETAQKMAQIAMLATMIVPMFALLANSVKTWAVVGIAKAVAGFKAVTASTALWMRAFAQAPSVTGHLAAGMKGVGKSILGFIGPMGLLIAGLTAAGVGAYLLWKRMNEGRDAVRDMYENAEGLGKILNYTPTDSGLQYAVDETGESFVGAQAKANAFKAEYSDLTNTISRTAKTAKGDQEAFNLAMSQGLKVIDTGGTAAQAKEAVAVALTAAKGKAEADRIMLKFQPQLDFSNLENQMQQRANQAIMALDVAFRRAASGTSELSWFRGYFAMKADVREGNELAEQAGKQVANAFTLALDSGVNTSGIEQKVATSLQTITTRIKEAEAAGREGMADKLLEQQAKYLFEFVSVLGIGAENWEEIRTLLRDGASLYSIMARYGVTMSAAGREQLQIERDLARHRKTNNYLQEEGTGAASAAAKNEGQLARYAGEAARNTSHLNDETKSAAASTERGASAARNWSAAVKSALGNNPMQAIADRFRGAMQSTQDIIAQGLQDDFQNRQDSYMDGLQANAERQMSRLNAAQDAESRRLSAVQERQSRNLDAEWERRNRAAESRWDKREDAINKRYDQRIDKIQEAIDAEQKAEDIRQKIFEAEMNRLNRLAESTNMNIDFNVALNTGELDEAAKISNNMVAQASEWALADSASAGEDRSEAKVDRLQERIDNIEKLKEARLKAFEKERDAFFRHLKKMEDAEKRSLAKRQDAAKRAQDRRHEAATRALNTEIENNREAAEDMWESRRKYLDKSIESFKAYVPKNEKDLRNHIASTREKYKEFNTAMKQRFNDTAISVHDTWLRQLNLARIEMSSEIDWATGGAKIADRIMKGMFGLDRQGFYKWMVTGKFPGKSAPPSLKDLTEQHNRRNRGGSPIYTATSTGVAAGTRHEGGIVGPGGKDSRKGVARTAKHHASEMNILAQKGEYVIQRKAVEKYGPGLFDQYNRGKVPGTDNKRGGSRPANDGLMGGAGGWGAMGMIAGAIGAAAREAAALASIMGATNAINAYASAGMPGGGTFGVGKIPAGFTAEQMKNASIIANVGKSLGASKRDIQIAFMTALVESGMRNLNYGDRDSLGMFQQRDAWGPAADRLNPAKSARMFFLGGRAGQRGLFDFKDRGSMSMGAAAQAVQVSAFPGRYQTQLDEAQAIWAALTRSTSGGGGGGVIAGPGGKHRPVAGGSPGGIHDAYTGYPAVDVAVPVGSKIFAVGDGKIIRSYDITGYEPRNTVQNGYRSYGRVIYQALDSGGSVLYAHLSSRFAQAGQRVSGGSVIGKSGNTGHSTGPHLHFGARPMSPYAFFKDGARDIRWDNTFANLHHGEAVLSKPINDEFKRGVKNFANGAQKTYNVNMIFNGDPGNKAELRRFIIDTFRGLDARLPTSRKGGD